MRLFHTSGALTTITVMMHLVHFTLAYTKDDISCAQNCADMSCETACIDSEGFIIHKTLVNDIANQPQIDEHGLSVEDTSDSTRMLQDEDCDDDDDMEYDSSNDDDEDCDEDEDDVSREYVVDPSNDDDEDCDNENERQPPYVTNASSEPAAQVPTSPFFTGSEDGPRPTVTAYTTITSEIFSPSADMLHASSNIISDVVESNGHMKSCVSISLLGVFPFALVVWLP